jgi:hypothetical protein
MTILLQRLVEYAWVFYAACGIGVIIYAVRALVAQREQKMSLFTLERDTATARIMRAWAMVLIFIAIGVVTFISVTVILPGLSIYNPETPLPTATLSAGVEPPTPDITSTPFSTIALLTPASTPLTATVPISTPLSSPPLEPTETPIEEPTETPTPEPTETSEAAISGELYIRFSDLAALTGYSLPYDAVTTGQPLPVTLYWQALEGTSPVNYLVFTHLLADDGHLVAQHDGVPAGGARPITGWLPGETIVDSHVMTFQDTAYTGPARIVVGLYDSVSGRVVAETGNDYFFLPVAISVIP